MTIWIVELEVVDLGKRIIAIGNATDMMDALNKVDKEWYPLIDCSQLTVFPVGDHSGIETL